MAGKFVYKKFAEINIEDPFFDSLKDDYPGTANTTGLLEWFQKKSIQGEEALVYSYENNQVGAFMYLKWERWRCITMWMEIRSKIRTDATEESTAIARTVAWHIRFLWIRIVYRWR